MNIGQLMAVFSGLPLEIEVEVNDVRGGEVYVLDSGKHLEYSPQDHLVVLEINTWQR